MNNRANLVRNGTFSLPWCLGGGRDLGLGSGSAAFAVHGNLGLAMPFRPVPIAIFLEGTPRLWVVDFMKLHPFDFNAGIRVWC